MKLPTSFPRLGLCGQNLARCALISAMLWPVAAAEKVCAAGEYLKIDYPASEEPGTLQTAVTYTLWIPDGVARLRGIIVHQHGAGTTASKEGSTAAYDLHWQALARKWDCGLLGPSYHVLNEKVDLTPGGSEHWFDPRRGSEKTFLKALGDFAAKSKRPELEKVPWVLWGHSGGGIWADLMTMLHPNRVVAAWLRSGSAAMFRTKPEFRSPTVPATLYAVPMMSNPGVKEMTRLPWIGPLATFQEYRANGAPIGFAPDPRTDHECGDSRYLAIPFLDACMAMRLPDKGSIDQVLKPVDMNQAWLAALQSNTAQPAAEFKGNPRCAVWLPNAEVAKAWIEYVKTGAVSDATPPPAPTHVRALGKQGLGIEITWEAEADFESGIGSFVVLRDGVELAKVPEKPIGKFGRPLFQSMTYHDTPAQPIPEMFYLDATAKAGEQHTYSVVTVNSVGLKSAPAPGVSLETRAATAKPNYAFDGMISREVLENYLDRSISYTELLHDDLTQPRNRRNVDPRDCRRMLLDCGAKFIGRALMIWGHEENLPAFLRTAKPFAEALHAADPEMVLQAAAFEIVTKNVERVPVPERILKEFSLPDEQRNFLYSQMLYENGQFVNHWGRDSSVPDMSRIETRMWFYHLVTSYIDAGIEAIHFGQIGLMDKNDPGHAHWRDMLQRVRSYAREHARRHFLICDAHTPTGGYVEEGKLLFDFHSFPLRIVGVPEQPYEGVLQIGYADSIFRRSKGGVTPSGWACEHLPYLVEFDNFGSRNPGQPSRSPYIWGWDEITWFALKPEDKRDAWLGYSWKWVKEMDPDGHLQMPGSRVLRAGTPDGPRWFWANARSDACPDGFNTEATIKELWGADVSKAARLVE